MAPFEYSVHALLLDEKSHPLTQTRLLVDKVREKHRVDSKAFAEMLGEISVSNPSARERISQFILDSFLVNGPTETIDTDSLEWSEILDGVENVSDLKIELDKEEDSKEYFRSYILQKMLFAYRKANLNVDNPSSWVFMGMSILYYEILSLIDFDEIPVYNQNNLNVQPLNTDTLTEIVNILIALGEFQNMNPKFSIVPDESNISSDGESTKWMKIKRLSEKIQVA